MVGLPPFESYLREQGVEALLGEPMARYTTFKIGGPVRVLASPATVEELAGVVARAREHDVPLRILGGGSNLLRLDGLLDACVVRLNRLARVDVDGAAVRVEGGADLPRLVKRSVALGLAGLECLAGVPGSVAGALFMNAGGRHGEIKDVVRHVDILDDAGSVRRLRRDEIDFRYRASSLQGSLIVGAELELRPDDPAAVRARYDAILADKKTTQPLGSPNAGCVFKNPPGGKAGRMIDECGLKGARAGRAHISVKHANFMINDGGAAADDVRRLIDLVRDRVGARFGVSLDLEILVW